MNRNIERCPNTAVAFTAGARDVVAQAARRIQGWFYRLERERLNREQNLRLEERNRERARIARDLHDTLFQGFLGVSLQLYDAVQQVPADSPSKPSLNRALDLMRRVIDEGRDALQGLRSSGAASMSLEQALCSVRDEFTPCGGVRLRVFVKGQPKKLSPEIQEQIYLIGREAMLNALRHGQATKIEADVEYLPQGLRLAVRDNGCGIDPKIVRLGRESHWGLVGMRERAGSIGAKLRIWSRPGAGTEIEISLPRNIFAEACA
jgi:signal transduction histidine kinase